MTIKEFRKNNGMTQEQFARMICSTLATIRNWEQGRTTPDRRSRIALEAVGFDLAEYDKERAK
jgi:putative transcriptional regulator